MQNSNVKGHIVESGIFLVGYMVSSLVVLLGIGNNSSRSTKAC